MSTDSNSQVSQKPVAACESSSPGRPAYRSGVAIVVFLLLAAIGAAGDLLSKHFVFDSFLSDPDLPTKIEEYRIAYKAHYHTDPLPKSLLSSLQRQACPGVKFTLSANPGIVFGLPMARWGVNIATMAAIVLVLGFFATSDSRAKLLHISLAMILAGAIGNLYDRLFSNIELPGAEPIRHHVRDFIDCSELYYKWIFNVADVMLVSGVGLLFIHSIFAAKMVAKKHSRKSVN